MEKINLDLETAELVRGHVSEKWGIFQRPITMCSINLFNLYLNSIFDTLISRTEFFDTLEELKISIKRNHVSDLLKEFR